MQTALRTLMLGGAALVASASAATAQIGAPKLPDVDWSQNLGFEVPLGTSFIDSEDRPVLLSDLLDDRPALLALVYFECPMLCDLVMNGLMQGLSSLSFDAGDEFEIIIISIDPEESGELTRTQRDGYIDRYGREAGAAGWHFLRGDKDSIDAVADAVGYQYTYVKETGEFAHPAGLAVLTSEGKVARILYGSEFASRDLKFSLMEAAGGNIGSPIDKIILRCFHYDPSRGVYGLAIMTTLRIVGSGLVAFMAFIIIRMIRRGNPTLTPDAGSGGQL